MINWQHFLKRAGKVTIALVALNIIIYIFSAFGDSRSEITQTLSFDKNAILTGELWRLITPAFIHFNVANFHLHILFNMMWLWELGGSIEKAKTPKYLLVLILIIGVGSNFFQYAYYEVTLGEFGASRILFGGMSGVVYGLLGFAFVRRRFDPFFPTRVNEAILNFMLIWMLLGFVGIVGNIANIAHLSGLLIGAALGYYTAKTKRF